MPTKKQIQPGEKVPLKLTVAERKLVLEDLMCLDEDYEQIIQGTPTGKPVMMTLDDLDDLEATSPPKPITATTRKSRRSSTPSFRRYKTCWESTRTTSRSKHSRSKTHARRR